VKVAAALGLVLLLSGCDVFVGRFGIQPGGFSGPLGRGWQTPIFRIVTIPIAAVYRTGSGAKPQGGAGDGRDADADQDHPRKPG
jgi:hypothetical protein